VKDYREIPYWFGTNRCRITVLNGDVIGSGNYLSDLEKR